ncbi:sugar phosphate isomerase/epimerase family protein [Bacillus kwashiorkori]|uniref:sugar phosphate isomerase/epimerase family protein n=1 Tax=Bacillus kwashiorkori TaxID=1522318 RepID=UPI0007824A8B|nr:sugar phosphate isomerase/epimerase [Bacillus kwashiorkori]
MKKIPVALQLYTLREQCEHNFYETLQKVAQLGYSGVELAGFHQLSADQLKTILDELNLVAISSHVPLADLQNNLEEVISNHKILNTKYIVCPYLLEEQRQESFYDDLIPFLEETGNRLRQEGLILCYHNHDFELETLSNGKTALETIFDSVSKENLQTELDIYWLTKAGENPLDWLHRYSGRTPLVHLKDMTLDDEKIFAELGTGGVNIDAVLQIGEQNQVEWWIVEQDQCKGDPLESVTISINYLKEKLPYLV